MIITITTDGGEKKRRRPIEATVDGLFLHGRVEGKRKKKKTRKEMRLTQKRKTRGGGRKKITASSMLRFRNSFDASQVLFLVLPLFVLVGIVPELPLPRAEYHVEGGAGDVNAGRDHEDEPPLRLSRLKNGKREME